MVWSLDKCADWVIAAIAKKFSEEEINKKSLKTPPPETAIRVLVGLQTTIALDEPLPRVLFANLLSGSMIQENDSESHPAFAEILKNMVAIECRLFSMIACEPVTVIESSAFTGGIGTEKDYFSNQEYPLEELLGLSDQSNIHLYLSNLERLGLVKTEQHRDLKPESAPTPEMSRHLHAHWEKFDIWKEGVPPEKCPSEITNTSIRVARLSSWGKHFASATGADRAWDRYTNSFNIPVWASVEDEP
jgi:Abortive infection alpha